ncbi:SOS response-associated peptidase [Paenibacillus xerothermodurans]|uniref:Abasic site processing protein n=1 Tax=Paenibacillus xerothermodurans TaxID=1977292 RepID=A0A2W1NC01_PAEXE|nr:SOS response-associated peptidase [Paenibacillus xerothermodurans]PZE21987.1 SOS response-associated peptidase [Paenibacillus xerothermodurans]
MCGRYTITVSYEELVLRFLLRRGTSELYAPRYNVAPGQWIPAVVDGTNGDGGITHGSRFGSLQWGLVPSWASGDKSGPRPINLRSETLADKPGFRKLLSRKRCLIPADGFYEWYQADGKKKPVRFTLRDHSLFGMAAVYDTWSGADGNKLHTCAIITVPANETMAHIHHRMPAILTAEQESIWLDRTVTEPERLLPLLAPYTAKPTTIYRVSTKVGHAAYDAPDCIDSIEDRD